MLYLLLDEFELFFFLLVIGFHLTLNLKDDVINTFNVKNTLFVSYSLTSRRM